MTKQYIKQYSMRYQKVLASKNETAQAITEADFYMQEYLQSSQTPPPWSWTACILYSLSSVLLAMSLQSLTPIILAIIAGASFFYLKKNFVYGSSKLI